MKYGFLDNMKVEIKVYDPNNYLIINQTLSKSSVIIDNNNEHDKIYYGDNTVKIEINGIPVSKSEEQIVWDDWM